MNSQQIKEVVINHSLPDTSTHADYIETNYSWIIRSDKIMYKIQKPLESDDWDFSNLINRKQFLEKELYLNRDLSEDVYKDIIPVKLMKSDAGKDEPDSSLIDYALRMKRVKNKQTLEHLLHQEDIDKHLIYEIALRISFFHKNAKVVTFSPNVVELQKRFDEVKRCYDFVNDLFGFQVAMVIPQCMKASRKLLGEYQDVFDMRSFNGQIRDVHGNLSAGNIIIANKVPKIINREVVDSHRQIDVLMDVARLGLDFEKNNLTTVDDIYLRTYLQMTEVKMSEEIMVLYNYYKMFNAIEQLVSILDDSTLYTIKKATKQDLLSYLKLIKKYTHQILN